MEILSKKFNDVEVLFSLGKDLYLHITPIAQKFGKPTANWLRNSETKKYIETLSKHLSISKEKLVVIQQGGKPEEQGTWIHKKLIIAFARWISPEFAIWCDEQIEEILQGTISPPKLSLSEIVSETREALELIEILKDVSSFDLLLLERILKENSPTKLLEIDFQNSYFLPTELGKLHGISGREANLKLEALGFQVSENGIWKLTESGKEFGMEYRGKFSQLKWKLEVL